MDRVLVKSSFIDSVGYEGDILEVVYKGGKTYRYIGVPFDLYKSVIGSESIGKAVREHIVKGGFDVEKVEFGVEE